MNIEGLKQEINEYFEYIKTIYLNEFSKYMKEDTRKYIRSLEDIFELEDDLTFKITNGKKITIYLDIKSFIEENDLKNENSLLDLSLNGKKYIEYFIKNEENVYQIIKNKILKEIIHYFCNCEKSVIALGTADLITEYLGNKYKLPFEQFIPSKEKEVALYFKDIVGDKILYTGIINQNDSIIKDAYNLYVDNNALEDYDSLTSYLDKTYSTYFQKIGKVYFSDSLYDYENLEYSVLGRAHQVKEEKNNLSMMQLKRLASLKYSLLDIENHQFLFTASEKILIKNSIIETNKILNAIMVDGRDHVVDHIGAHYNHLLEIEEASLKFAQKLWSSVLTSTDYYESGKEFNFLLANSIDDVIVEATYVTSNLLRNIKTSKSDYGFVVEPIEGGLIYASSKDFLYRNCSKDPDYKPTCNTVYAYDIPLEIDNQEISKLITPDMIEQENIKEKIIQNKILLDKNHLRKVAIYALTSDLEDSPSYQKALLLSEEYQLPIVRISPIDYFSGIEEKKVKKDVRIKLTEEAEKPKSFFDKVKEARDRLLYEDTKNDEEETS